MGDRSVRALRGWSTLSITGYAEAEAVCDRPHGIEILLKPFTEHDLEAAIARVCASN